VPEVHEKVEILRPQRQGGQESLPYFLNRVRAFFTRLAHENGQEGLGKKKRHQCPLAAIEKLIYFH
jgi:hypothetical protein